MSSRLALPILIWCGVLGCFASAALGAPAPADSVVRRWLDQARTLATTRQSVPLDSVATLALERAQGLARPDTSAIALALFYRGAAHFIRTTFADRMAEQFLIRSANLYPRIPRPDTARWVGTLDLLALLLYETDRTDSSLKVIGSARALCVPALGGADTLNAKLWITEGRNHRRAGRFTRAIAAYDSSRTIRERRYGHEHQSVAEAIAQAGGCYGRMHLLSEALRDLTEAIGILERTLGPNSLQLITPLTELASVYTNTGDVARAIETLERSVEITAAVYGPDSPRLVPPSNNIAIRLFDFGDHAGARALCEALLPRAEAGFGAGSARAEHVRYMAGLMAIMTGDTAVAAAHLTRTRDNLRGKPLDASHVATLVERPYSILLGQRGDWDGARRVIEDALARERDSPNAATMLPLLDRLVDVQIATGDSAGLERTVAEIDQHFAANYAASNLYQRTRARAELGLGDRAAATRFALGSEVLERERLLRNVRALPEARALQLVGEVSDGLEMLVRLSDGGEASVVTAWDCLVRWRGLVTAELAARRAPPQASSDTALARAHAEWVQARLARARLEVSSSGGAALEASRAAVDDAERRYGRMALAHGFARDTMPVDFARVRSRLGAGEALASIVTVEKTSEAARLIVFATVGPSGALSRIDLGRARDVSDAIAAWRTSLETPPQPSRRKELERECRRLGAVVRARTWDRIAPSLGRAERVMLVADGELADLPWQALPSGSNRYLVDEAIEIHTLGAERDLLADPRRDGRGLLALGDPDFDAGQSPTLVASAEASAAPASAPAETPAKPGSLVSLLRGAQADCGGATVRLSRLPGARAEVEDIVRAWNAAHPSEPAMLLVGGQGSEAAFKANASGRAVLHLATHGVVLGRECAPVYEPVRGVGGVDPVAAKPASRPAAKQPAKSKAPATPAPENLLSSSLLPPSPFNGRRVWLALGGANRPHSEAADENEGLLTADEVVTMDLRGVDWVVLSACQSGVGQRWPLDGSVGIRWAFQLAGANAVIASQWSIADDATREWMRALYAARGAGPTSAIAAMRAASRSVLAARRSAGRDTHPFSWAAFTAVGR